MPLSITGWKGIMFEGGMEILISTIGIIKERGKNKGFFTEKRRGEGKGPHWGWSHRRDEKKGKKMVPSPYPGKSNILKTSGVH